MLLERVVELIMDLSIIIPSKDRESILYSTLALAYKAIEKLDAEIIVVNDSKSNNIEIGSGFDNRVRVFDNPKSGVASARNYGASMAKGALYLFLDDDIWISEDNLRATLTLHKDMSDCCINLNWIYPPGLDKEIKQTQFGRYLHHFGFADLKGWCRGIYWDDNNLFPINRITSQYLSMKKEDFGKVGGYNDEFPHAGFEDHDFCVRLLKHHIQPYIYPLSTVYHNEADRMDIKAWLARKKRGGETRKVAAQMGYQEVALYYGVAKSSIYKLLMLGKPALINILLSIPNVPALDPFYFRILNLLLGAASYEGYTNK